MELFRMRREWYGSSMMSAAQLMRMLGAVIALIAVQVVPLPAQAHAGRVHGMHAHHASPHHHAAAVDADHDRATSAAQAAELRSTDQLPAGNSDTAHGCANGCCGSGMSCCGGTALIVAADQPLPTTRSSSLGLERSAAAGGIDPDALRKPPRSLA